VKEYPLYLFLCFVLLCVRSQSDSFGLREALDPHASSLRTLLSFIAQWLNSPTHTTPPTHPPTHRNKAFCFPTGMGPRLRGSQAAAASGVALVPAATGKPGSIRVKADGFKVDKEYIAAVCLSAIGELQRHCPALPTENVVIEHGGGQGHAIVLHDRSDQGEVVIHLETSKTFWSQYAYQITHEISHVHCGFCCGPTQNLWFEEVVCETASLFCLRAMARTWQTNPPYPTGWTTRRPWPHTPMT